MVARHTNLGEFLATSRVPSQQASGSISARKPHDAQEVALRKLTRPTLDNSML